MNRAYTLINAFGFTLIGTVLIMNSCVNKTYTTHNHLTTQDTVFVKDTAEVKRWKAESKRFEKSAYDYQQKYYAKCREVKQLNQVKVVEPKKEVARVQTQTRNAFPIVAEYNARTDKWPVTKNPKVLAAQEKNRAEWDSLWEQSKDYRREEDSELFKP